ncbi:MAG: hypothetical protein KTR31_25125 [Myxococcales bacterium]|nr:hypothetical protein [Myxococcales bacterium]
MVWRIQDGAAVAERLQRSSAWTNRTTRHLTMVGDDLVLVAAEQSDASELLGSIESWQRLADVSGRRSAGPPVPPPPMRGCPLSSSR